MVGWLWLNGLSDYSFKYILNIGGYMDFHEALDSVLIGMPELPKDGLIPVKSNLEKAEPGKRVSQLPKPTRKLAWRAKAPLSDSVERGINEAEGDLEKPQDNGLKKPSAPETDSPEEIIDPAELDSGEDLEGLDVPPGDESRDGTIPGLPSGRGYNVQQAKGQLDGIIKQWMDMAGNYPEGDKRHNFLEIGERLREISAVINRDYIEKQ